jgi:hypothetical protein
MQTTTGNLEREKMKSKMAIPVLATMFSSAVAIAAEGPVVWADSACNYFIVRLPEGSPDEGFGLFGSKIKSVPSVGDVIEGDILGVYEVEVTEKATGKKYAVVHWANGKSQETLVRHSPVHCTSRYKKK